MASPLRVPYKRVYDVDLPTDVYLPAAADRPAPVLIMIHGGAFMLGSSALNNKDQIQDCMERGWIVLGVEHRLCPGVNVLEGPMADVRDAVAWTQDGGLAKALQENGSDVVPDADRVLLMGTSSGGHLALSTAWTTSRAPLAILDFYGSKHFAHPFWTTPVDSLPLDFRAPRPDNEIAALHAEKTTFIGGMSLEGQASSSASASDPNPAARQAFAMNAISTGNAIRTIWPAAPHGLDKIDPLLNVSAAWPPVGIVHGTADQMVPMHLSKALWEKLKEVGVETEFFEVEGEPHTFAGKMVKGGRTWELQRRGFEWLEGIVRRSYGEEKGGL